MSAELERLRREVDAAKVEYQNAQDEVDDAHAYRNRAEAAWDAAFDAFSEYLERNR